MEAFEELAEYVDLFLFDVKHVDPEKVKAVTGGNLERIFRNLSYLAKHKRGGVIIRMPVIPQFNYETEVIMQIFELAQRLGIREVHLLPYHTLGIHKYEQLGILYQMPRKGIQKEELQPYVEMGEQMGLIVCIGG
jgi:pyruvate formate lyase activating enzyme